MEEKETLYVGLIAIFIIENNTKHLMINAPLSKI